LPSIDNVPGWLLLTSAESPLNAWEIIEAIAGGVAYFSDELGLAGCQQTHFMGEHILYVIPEAEYARLHEYAIALTN
jgi:hypothetical protein